MRHLSFLICLLLFSTIVRLNAGDTTFVRAHDKRHLNGYGNFDEWTVFPSGSQSYERIWLHLTYGCPATNCSQWDYTTKVFYRQHTGTLDSVLKQAPWFKANGQSPDSILFTLDTTWVYSYNTTTQTTDSVPSGVLTLIQFQDSLNPLTPTDTLYAYPAGYYNYLYDTGGNIIDSLWVMQDSTWMQGFWPYYDVFEVVHNIEITRAITPYGGLLPNTWEFTWKADVTDYAPLFKDSADFRVVYEGYQDGFTISLDFIMVKGTPPREALEVRPLWTGGFSYGINSDPIENHLNPRLVQIPSFASGGTKLRILQTGHGFGGNENCAEFCPKAHYILIDNVNTHAGMVWRNQCGLNPIFPQGGTWIYDRANWCPGEIVNPYEYELGAFVSPGNTYTLDMDMDPFTNVNNNFPGYGIGANLIFYGPPNFTLEAGIEEILSPSNDMRFHRFNPVCGNPEIVIRNGGTQPIQSVELEYGVSGSSNVSTYIWNAPVPLEYLDTVRIDLPAPDYTDPSGSGKFFARIVQINNSGADPYPANDTLLSVIDIPPIYQDGIIISLKANTAASETKVQVYDVQNNIVFSKSNYTANALEKDTVLLPHGCYRFELTDTGRDGLSFFTFNNDGNGTARLQSVASGALLINFEPNFGTSQIHYFTVGYGMSQEKNLPQTLLNIYPNPAQDFVQILCNTEGFKADITDLTGRILQTYTSSSEELNISVKEFINGIYLLRIQTGEEVHTERLIIKH